MALDVPLELLHLRKLLADLLLELNVALNNFGLRATSSSRLLLEVVVAKAGHVLVVVLVAEHAPRVVDDHILLAAGNLFLLVEGSSAWLLLLLTAPLSGAGLLIAQWLALILVTIEVLAKMTAAAMQAAPMCQLLMRQQLLLALSHRYLKIVAFNLALRQKLIVGCGAVQQRHGLQIATAVVVDQRLEHLLTARYVPEG